MADEVPNEGAEATPSEGGAEATPADGQTGDQGQQTPADTTPSPADGHFSSRFADENARKIAGRYNSEEAMAQALYSANTELSKRIKPLPADASDEDRSAYMEQFRSAMGLPDKPEGYAFEKPEAVPDEVFQSEAIQGRLAEVQQLAFEHGAPPAMVQALLNKQAEWDAAEAAAQAKADEDHAAEVDAALRKEWGSNYDANKAVAEEFATQHQAGDIFNLELKPGPDQKDGMLLSNYAPFVKLMAVAGRAAMEGGLQAGLSGTQAGQDLQTQYDQLGKDIYDAKAAGDSQKAQQLADKRREISLKLHGNQVPVGAGGRTA